MDNTTASEAVNSSSTLDGGISIRPRQIPSAAPPQADTHLAGHPPHKQAQADGPLSVQAGLALNWNQKMVTSGTVSAAPDVSNRGIDPKVSSSCDDLCADAFFAYES